MWPSAHTLPPHAHRARVDLAHEERPPIGVLGGRHQSLSPERGLDGLEVMFGDPTEEDEPPPRRTAGREAYQFRHDLVRAREIDERHVVQIEDRQDPSGPAAAICCSTFVRTVRPVCRVTR